jgi:hypothetical protein
MTTRRWMIAVTVVAIVMSGAVSPLSVETLASEYRRLYAQHSVETQLYRQEASKARELKNARNRYVLASRRAAYHAHLEAKYGHAAHSPWFPVEPDPPEPK